VLTDVRRRRHAEPLCDDERVIVEGKGVAQQFPYPLALEEVFVRYPPFLGVRVSFPAIAPDSISRLIGVP
jgi:hypothetical protein